MQQQVASITVQSPEGPFRLAAQRAASCAFNPERSTHLTIARLGSDGDYLVFNVLGALHVASLSAVDRASKRRPPARLKGRVPGGGRTGSNRSSRSRPPAGGDEHRLEADERRRRVPDVPQPQPRRPKRRPPCWPQQRGRWPRLRFLPRQPHRALAAGRPLTALCVPAHAAHALPAVSLLSLRVQLHSAPGAVPWSAAGMSFNVDGSANATRCVGVAWVAGAVGSAFASAHRDGGICLWQKVRQAPLAAAAAGIGGVARPRAPPCPPEGGQRRASALPLPAGAG